MNLNYIKELNSLLNNAYNNGLLNNITWQFDSKPIKNGMATEYMIHLYYEDDLYEDDTSISYAKEDWGCQPHFWKSTEELVEEILAYSVDWKPYLIDSYYNCYLEDKDNGEDLSCWERYMDDFA